MNQVLEAGAPLAACRFPVGHRSTRLVDAARRDRAMDVECWYPAAVSADEAGRAVYEVIPGVGFSAIARTGAPVALGSHPLVVFSHGRSGVRTSYVLLCEGLAARGYVVVAPDHPGDTLLDWMTGSAVDDATNEAQRVADVAFVLDALLADRSSLAPMVSVDDDRIAVAGHSYGGFTALAVVAAETADERVRAVAGLQPFARSLRRSALARIAVPSLLIVGARDETCPPATDADRVSEVVTRADARRIDIAAAGHQACSDVGLYLELEAQVDGLPEIVATFLASMAAQVTGRPGDPWRPTVALHLRILAAWLDDVLDVDPARAASDLAAIRGLPGLTARGFA
ncbi:MAG: alpha/beta hydrolase family protein [Acidimicrobiia bacterium]